MGGRRTPLVADAPSLSCAPPLIKPTACFLLHRGPVSLLWGGAGCCAAS